MISSRYWFIAFLIALLVFSACGREDDSIAGKAYHNFTAFFNAYYNARTEYQRGVVAIEASLKYERNAPLEIFPSIESATSGKQYFDKVVKKASIVLQSHPVSSLADNALLLMGKAYYYLKSLEAAERKFKEIITNFPNSDVIDEATFWYGRTLAQLQQVEEAKSILGSVIASKKSNDHVRAEAFFSLAELAIKEELFDEATDEIEKGLLLCNDDNLKSRAAFTLARVYDKQQKYKEAARSYQLVIDLDPIYDVLYAAQLNYAIDLRKQGALPQAINRFQKLLDDDKNYTKFAEIRYELAECFVLQDRLGKAIDLYIEIIRRSKKTEPSAKSFYQLGRIKQFITGDFETARAFYDSSRTEFAQGEIKQLADEAYSQIDKILTLYEERSVIDSTLQLGLLKPILNDTSKKILDSVLVQKTDDSPLVRRLRREYRRSLTLSLGGKDVFGETAAASELRVSKPRFSLSAARDTATFIKYHKDFLDRTASIGNFYHLTLPMPDSALLWYNLALDITRNTIFNLSDSVKTQVQKSIVPLLFAIADVHRSKGEDDKMDSLYRVILAEFPQSQYTNRIREHYGLEIVQDKIKVDKALYHTAFDYIDHKRYELALAALDSLVIHFPTSVYRPKAILATAFLHYEKFNRPDSALVKYKLLASLYPQSEEAEFIQPTLLAYKAIRDSIAALSDSSNKMTDSTQLQHVPADSLMKGQKKKTLTPAPQPNTPPVAPLPVPLPPKPKDQLPVGQPIEQPVNPPDRQPEELIPEQTFFKPKSYPQEYLSYHPKNLQQHINRYAIAAFR